MKGTVVSALCLIFAAAGFSPRHAAAENGWLADPRSGCKAWINAIDAGAVVRWEGACVGGFVDGRGTLQYLIGGKVTVRIEGEFRGGKREGRAVVFSENGDRFEGEYRDGVPNGRGIKTMKNGTRLEVEYVDGKASGYGVMLFASGDRYEGGFKDTNQDGKGIYIWKDGQRYEGEWRNGARNGRGVVSKDGERYEGEWKDDKRDGYGVYVWPSGRRYEGNWRNGQPHGAGSLRSLATDGSVAVWSGEWRDGCYSANGRTATFSKTHAECGFE